MKKHLIFYNINEKTVFILQIKCSCFILKNKYLQTGMNSNPYSYLIVVFICIYMYVLCVCMCIYVTIYACVYTHICIFLIMFFCSQVTVNIARE